MNREILFRGKRIDNGEWVEGDLVRAYRCVEGDPINVCLDGGVLIMNETGLHSVDPETVGQYILTDKNGKKVFEGDIVKRYDSARAYQVKWNPTFPAFWCFRPSDYKFLLTEDFEVIGSIHDNPELLEEANG